MDSRTRVPLILITCCQLLVGSCQSLKKNARFARCEFRITKVSSLEIGGIQTLDKNSLKDFNFQQGLILANQIRQKKLMADVTLNIQVKNPNDLSASLEGFQYVIVIDGKEVLNKEITSTVDIGGNSQAIFALRTRFDLVKAASDTGYDTLLRMVLGLVDNRQQPVKFDMYFRPYLKVLNKRVKYPDFIKLSSVYQGGSFE
ncbi:MAG: hypothetical protein WBA74_24810 [Cyclobacteriaceae bacterium]